jgi:hypothetical protein
VDGSPPGVENSSEPAALPTPAAEATLKKSRLESPFLSFSLDFTVSSFIFLLL